MGRDPMGERRKGGVRSGSHAADCPWMDAVGRLSARPQTKFGRQPCTHPSRSRQWSVRHERAA